LLGIEEVPYAKSFTGVGDQLHQAKSAFVRYRPTVEVGLRFDECANQTGIDAMVGGDGIDQISKRSRNLFSKDRRYFTHDRCCHRRFIVDEVGEDHLTAGIYESLNLSSANEGPA